MEPVRYLQARSRIYGTTEHKSSKWPERDSNPGPPDCESDALTTWPRCLPVPYDLIHHFSNKTVWEVLEQILQELWIQPFRLAVINLFNSSRSSARLKRWNKEMSVAKCNFLWNKFCFCNMKFSAKCMTSLRGVVRDFCEYSGLDLQRGGKERRLDFFAIIMIDRG